MNRWLKAKEEKDNDARTIAAVDSFLADMRKGVRGTVFVLNAGDTFAPSTYSSEVTAEVGQQWQDNLHEMSDYMKAAKDVGLDQYMLRVLGNNWLGVLNQSDTRTF